jgi:hypothetical protein
MAQTRTVSSFKKAQQESVTVGESPEYEKYLANLFENIKGMNLTPEILFEYILENNQALFLTMAENNRKLISLFMSGKT